MGDYPSSTFLLNLLISRQDSLCSPGFCKIFSPVAKKVSLSYFLEKLFEAFDYEKCRKFETLFSTIASHEILNRQNKATFLAGQESTADLGTG